MEKFVVYHIKSTMQVGPLPRSGKPHSLYAKTYKSAGFAKRACDKFNSEPRMVTHWVGTKLVTEEAEGPGKYGFCSTDHYRNRVVRMVERTNLISGKKFVEPSNTPGYCSPSTEAYWSA